MTGRDVPDDDMLNVPRPSRRDAPVTGDASLAALLAWAQFPESSAPEMRPVGEILAALTAGPADDELAGEASVLAAYRNRPGAPRPAHGTHRRTQRPFSSLLSVTAATAAAAIVALGALATAAYAGALPSPVQRIAHVIIGAPAARAHPALSPPSVGPGPNGHAGVPATHQGTSPSSRPHPVPTLHDTGQPTTQPAPSDTGTATPTHGKGKGKGKGKPTTHPTPPGHG